VAVFLMQLKRWAEVTSVPLRFASARIWRLLVHPTAQAEMQMAISSVFDMAAFP